jgi:hypothetical protein
MKFSFVAIILLITSNCIAQNKAKALLKEFNFDNGGYFLLGHDGIKNTDSILGAYGDFYIDDIPTLNEIKSNWKFHPKKESRLKCKQFYALDICKNGYSEKELFIKNDCGKIIWFDEDTNHINFYTYKLQEYEYAFSDSELIKFKNSFKKAFKEEKKFESLEQARNYRDSILNDTNLIMTDEDAWVKFEGTFVITYFHNLNFNWKHYEHLTNTALTNLSKEIKKKYPGQPFYLEGQGTDDKEVIVEIYCNKELSDKFILYPIECCKWEQFEPILVSYWRTSR